MDTALVLRAKSQDQSSGSEDGCRDVIEPDINGYPKVKSRGWRSDPFKLGASYGRHQGKSEHSKVEDDDDDDADTEPRLQKGPHSGHRERGRHTSPVREHNPYAYTHSDPHRRVTTVNYSVVVVDEELGLGEAVQREHRNDLGGSRSRHQSTTSARTMRDNIARSAGVGESRSRHQSTTSARTVRDHSPSPTQPAETSPRPSSPTPSQHSASRRSTSASDQHEQRDPPESDKDIDKGSTAPEPEILDSSRESNEERPALRQPDVESTSHSGEFLFSEGSKDRKEKGHTRKGHGAWVRPSRKRG